MTETGLERARRQEPTTRGDGDTAPAHAAAEAPLHSALGEGLVPVRMEPPGTESGLTPFRFTEGLRPLDKLALRRSVGEAPAVYADGTESAALLAAKRRATESGLDL